MLDRPNNIYSRDYSKPKSRKDKKKKPAQLQKHVMTTGGLELSVA